MNDEPVTVLMPADTAPQTFTDAAADGKADHQSVVRVMDVAGKVGFVNINISTRVPVGERP